MANPLLALDVQAPSIDIAGSIGRGQELQTVSLGNALKAYQIQQAQREDARTNALQQVYQQSGPGLASGDEGAINKLATLDPTAAVKFRGDALEQKTSASNLAQSDFKLQSAKNDHIAGVMGAVVDAPDANKPLAYKWARQQLVDNGNDVSKMPETYSPEMLPQLQATRQAALTAKDQLDNQQKAATEAETNRHNLADEKTARGNLAVAQDKATQESYGAPTMIGFTGPDGEEKQVAGIYNKKNGQYIDAETMQPIVNPKNLRVIGNATGGGRSMAMAGRVSTAALDASTDIENMSGIATGGNAGLFSTMQNTPLNALGRTLRPQSVQDMQTTMAGLSRAMSLLGSGGMQGSSDVMKSFDALEPQAGDSQLTVMRKLGSFRQQASNGIDAALASPMYSPAQKKQLQSAKDKIENAIPWLPADVQQLENGGDNSASMHSVFSAKKDKGPEKTKSGATVSDWPGATP